MIIRLALLHFCISEREAGCLHGEEAVIPCGGSGGSPSASRRRGPAAQIGALPRFGGETEPWPRGEKR